MDYIFFFFADSLLVEDITSHFNHMNRKVVPSLCFIQIKNNEICFSLLELTITQQCPECGHRAHNPSPTPYFDSRSQLHQLKMGSRCFIKSTIIFFIIVRPLPQHFWRIQLPRYKKMSLLLFLVLLLQLKKRREDHGRLFH